MRKDSPQKRQIIAMVASAALEGDERGVFIALPEEKNTVRALERAGRVVVERTRERCSCFYVWWVRFPGDTPRDRLMRAVHATPADSALYEPLVAALRAHDAAAWTAAAERIVGD